MLEDTTYKGVTDTLNSMVAAMASSSGMAVEKIQLLFKTIHVLYSLKTAFESLQGIESKIEEFENV